MARLGHYYEQDTFMTLEELAMQFKVENLGKSPAKFDYQQLLRWQQEVIARKTLPELWEWCNKKTHELVPPDKRDDFLTMIKPNVLFPEQAEKYATIFFTHQENDWQQAHQEILQSAGAAFFNQAIEAITTEGQDFKAVSEFLQKAQQVKGKALFQPLRIALTDEAHGPDMGSIFRIFTQDEIIRRLTRARDAIKN